MYNKRYYLDNVFDNLFKEEELLKTDIYEQNEKYVFEIDVPGIKKEDIKLEFEQGYLKLRIVENKENNEENKNYLRKERTIRNLQRSFYIGNINEDEIEAHFKDGILKVEVPKEEKKNNSIEINVD